MKLFYALSATTLLIAANAFATAAPTAPSAPAPKPAAAATAPAPAATKPAPEAAKPAPVMDACSKDATTKNLHGKARKAFLKDCRAAKK